MNRRAEMVSVDQAVRPRARRYCERGLGSCIVHLWLLTDDHGSPSCADFSLCKCSVVYIYIYALWIYFYLIFSPVQLFYKVFIKFFTLAISVS